MISFASIALGSGGAVACVQCQPKRVTSTCPADQISRAIADAALEWSAGPGPNITFVGSEPFAHPQLPQLIQAGVSAGCERIRLRTDGGALGGSGNAAGAFHSGVRHIELVLLGGDADRHDRLSGRPGLFDAAMTGLATFTSVARTERAAIAVTGYVPLCRHNAGGLASIIGAYAHAGAVSVLVELSGDFEPPPAMIAEALRAATVSGIALHGPRISPFAAEPWSSRGLVL